MAPLSDLVERFAALVASADSDDRLDASALLTRNPEYLSPSIDQIIPLFIKLIADPVAAVADQALRAVPVVLQAVPVRAPDADTLFQVVCAALIDGASGAISTAFRAILLHCEPAERSARAFAFVVPHLLAEAALAKTRILAVVAILDECIEEVDVREFLGPLVLSSAADAHVAVRAAAVPAMAALARRLKPAQARSAFLALCGDPNWSVRAACVERLHEVAAIWDVDAAVLGGIMRQWLGDASLTVAQTAALQVVRWVALFNDRSSVPDEVAFEFSEVFRLFAKLRPHESALCLAEKFTEALVVLGPDAFDEGVFMDAVTLFHRPLDSPSQTALMRGLGQAFRCLPVQQHVFMLLDMQLKAHRCLETFEAAVMALLELLPNLEEAALLRLLVTLSLQPKRHVGAWRRRLVVAERLTELAGESLRRFENTENSSDLVRHVLVPLWMRLLADSAKQVRETAAAASGKMFEMVGRLVDGEKLLDHVWGVFGASESAGYRQTFIRFAVAVLVGRTKEDAGTERLAERLASLERDSVETVRVAWERSGARSLGREWRPDREEEEGIGSLRRASDVGWLFGEQPELSVSEETSDFSSDRPISPPADYVEAGEAHDAWASTDDLKPS